MEHHRPDKAAPDLGELKDHIALEYGRCLLKLQLFELTLKATLPSLKMSGFSDELADNLERDRQKLGGKTLGHLVGELSLRTTLSDEQEIDDALIDRPYMSFRFGLEDGEWLNEKLRQLVDLRNELAHHFLSRFALDSEANCQEAISYLSAASNTIKDNREALAALLTAVDESRNYLVDLMNSPAGEHLFLYGILPGVPISNWPSTAIVLALQDAERSIAQGGWTSLNEAISSIRQLNPELYPKRYGCSSWREVIHQSQLFDVDKRLSPSGVTTWYRTRRS